MTKDLDKLIFMYRTDPTVLDNLLTAISSYAKALAIRNDRRNDAEDIGQDMAIRCWQKLDQYEVSKGSFKRWVQVATLNYLRNEAELLENRMTLEMPEHMPEPQGSDTDTTTVSLVKYNDREKALLYWTAIDQDFSTTAKRFDVTPQELRRRLHRIKTKYNPAA